MVALTIKEVFFLVSGNFFWLLILLFFVVFSTPNEGLYRLQVPVALLECCTFVNLYRLYKNITLYQSAGRSIYLGLR